jgi:transposase-like protein
MYRLLTVVVLSLAGTACAQIADHAAEASAPKIPSPRVQLALSSGSDDLPDAPSQTVAQQSSNPQDIVATTRAYQIRKGTAQKPCNLISSVGMIYFDPNKLDQPRPRCSELVYPYQRFLSTNIAVPLNWKQKGYLAIHYTTDLTSIGTIVGIAAINVAADSHTAYGPGWKGFGKLAGISELQNATAEFFGTFAVPSLTHQDPRYYRMPGKPIGKRILYAVTRSYISRDDAGRPMPNYGVLAAYPAVAELGNLYVPGLQTDGPSTATRILTGYATDPINNLVNEFLPDVAAHVHIRVIFLQQIINNIAVTNSGAM